jgi:hypothetical protein
MLKLRNNNTIKIALSIFTVFIVFGLISNNVLAANLSVVADKSSVKTGETFTATVYINTQGVAINNAEAELTFDPSALQVLSINTAGSIFSLWVQQPTFSNGAGTISFTGGVPNPGYTGASGKVFSISFKALKEGEASVTFDTASILSNDGSGTDVTNNLNPATISVKTIATSETKPQTDTTDTNADQTQTAPKSQVSDTVGNIPPTPVITSREIPSETEWYSVETATFKWSLPSDVTSVQTSIDTKLDGIPNKTFTPAVNSRTVVELQDGTGYFHIRFKNAAGWSAIGTYKINIDTQPPKDFQLTTDTTKEGLNQVTLKATDVHSGMSKYVIYVDGSEIMTLDAENDIAKTKILPVLTQGKHVATVRAYDKAKNYLEKTFTFTSPELKKPVIIGYPSNVPLGSKISIAGNAFYPNTVVKLYLMQDKDNPQVLTGKADADGFFKFESDILTARKIVSVVAETVLSDGETALQSEKAYIQMERSLFATSVAKVLDILSVTVPLIALIIISIVLLYISFVRFKIKRTKLQAELKDAELELHEEFLYIQKAIKSYSKTLEGAKKKRDLTKEETKVLKDLSKVVAKSEKVLELKLKNLEEESE